MKRRERRTRRENKRRSKLLLAGFTVSVVLLAFVVSPSGAFTFGTADRDASVNVIGDEQAVYSLDEAKLMEEGQISDFVNITNKFGGETIDGTIQLRPPADEEAVLYVNGAYQGEQYNYTLTPGETLDVDLCPSDGLISAGDSTAPYNVSGSSPSGPITGNISERTVPVEDNVVEVTNCGGGFL